MGKILDLLRRKKKKYIFSMEKYRARDLALDKLLWVLAQHQQMLFISSHA